MCNRYHRKKIKQKGLVPAGNMLPVKEQNCTMSFLAETARGQSSQ